MHTYILPVKMDQFLSPCSLCLRIHDRDYYGMGAYVQSPLFSKMF